MPNMLTAYQSGNILQHGVAYSCLECTVSNHYELPLHRPTMSARTFPTIYSEIYPLLFIFPHIFWRHQCLWLPMLLFLYRVRIRVCLYYMYVDWVLALCRSFTHFFDKVRMNLALKHYLYLLNHCFHGTNSVFIYVYLLDIGR